MPLYIYENKKTGEVREVFQGMKDVHEYHGEDKTEKGLWRRIYVNPNVSCDTKVDPFNKESFKQSTINKKDSYGDLFKRSEEASQKRSEIHGKDPVKEKYYSDYSKMTNGKTHPQKQKEIFEKVKKKAEKKGINISF